MKQIIKSKKIEISVAFAFVLLSLGLVNFALADKAPASSAEAAKAGKGLHQNKEETIRKITDKKAETIRNIDNRRAETERKVLKIKEAKDRFEGGLEERKTKFGTSTFATSTAKFDERASSTASFRKRELEKIKKEEENFAKRFDNNIERLNNLYGKILEKVGKFEKKGVNATETKTLLALAKSKIDIAKSDVGDLKKAISGGISGQNEKDYSASIKNLSIKARNSIKDAQDALSNAISSLKPGLNKDKSSSPSSSTTSSVSSATASSGSISSGASSSAASSSIRSSSSSSL